MSELWGLKGIPKIIHYYLPHAYLIGGSFQFLRIKQLFMSRRSMNNYQKKFLSLNLLKFVFIKKWI